MDFNALDEHPVGVELDPCVRVSIHTMKQIFWTALQWVSDAPWVVHKDCALSTMVWVWGFSLEGNGESGDMR